MESHSKMPPQSDTAITGMSIALPRDRAILVTKDGGDFVFVPQQGLIALECRNANSRRRILDFLVPGDRLSSRTLTGFERVRLCAVETSAVFRYPRAAWLGSMDSDALQSAAEVAAARTYLNNAIVGLADIDARVVSFMMALLLRQKIAAKNASHLEISISREDVADHILVNPDTLSRSYSRLRELEIIERNQRNILIVRDWDRLASMSPLADVIQSVCG